MHARCIRRMEWRRRRGGALGVFFFAAYNFFVCFSLNFYEKKLRNWDLKKHMHGRVRH